MIPSAVSNSSAPALIGAAVQNYIIDHKLGEGGMGTVFLARHARLPNTWAALKILSRIEHGAQIGRFEQEAVVAAALGTERVARPIDLGTLSDGTPYILMEFVSGRSLDQRLKERGALPVLEALEVTALVADTLVLAHDKGIIHRDIKPSNIMVQDKPGGGLSVKLLDFGVARATGTLKRARTSANVLLGTPGYMSPEAAAGIVIDGRSDVFSLAVVLYEMLTATSPFASRDLQESLAMVLTWTPPPVETCRARTLDPVPPTLEAVLARALAKRPGDRFTMAQFLDALLCEIKAANGQTIIAEAAASPTSAAPTLSSNTADLDALLDRLGTPRTPIPSPWPSAPPPPAATKPDRRRAIAVIQGVLCLAVMLAAAVATIKLMPRPSPRVSLPTVDDAVSPQVNKPETPPSPATLPATLIDVAPRKQADGGTKPATKTTSPRTTRGGAFTPRSGGP